MCSFFHGYEPGWSSHSARSVIEKTNSVQQHFRGFVKLLHIFEQAISASDSETLTQSVLVAYSTYILGFPSLRDVIFSFCSFSNKILGIDV